MHNPYEDYYLNQVGKGAARLPVYSGLPVQRGHGFGGILRSLARSAAPLLKRGAIAVGKQLLKTGGRVASDVVAGKNLKTSLKRRAQESIQDLGKKVLGIKNASVPKKKKRKVYKRIPKRQPDIFD